MDAIGLPAGYEQSFGGEVQNSGDVSQPMMVAGVVSICAILLVLFLQFRRVSS